MAQFKTLKSAVMAQLNGTTREKRETLRDVASHGADVGIGGFIYYAETAEFARKNRALILAAIREDVDNLGADSAVSLMKGWRVFKHYTPAEIEGMFLDYAAGENPKDTTLVNALAWYALETVAHQVED